MPIVLIAIAGFLGADLRYAFSEWIVSQSGFPAATLVINLSGSLFLGWFYTVTLHRWYLHPTLRLAIGTGFVGAFTTFSTFAVEWWSLTQSHHQSLAYEYLLLSGGGGLACAALGIALGLRQSRLRLY